MRSKTTENVIFSHVFQTILVSGGKYLPEEVRHPEYEAASRDDEADRDVLSLQAAGTAAVGGGGSLKESPPVATAGSGGGVESHQAGGEGGGGGPVPRVTNASFVRANQEKIVVCLTAAVSLGLVGVLVIVIGRMFRTYRHRLMSNPAPHLHHHRRGSSIILSSMASGQSSSAVDLDNCSSSQEEVVDVGVTSRGLGSPPPSHDGRDLPCRRLAYDQQQPMPVSSLEAALHLEAGRAAGRFSAVPYEAAAVGSLYGTVSRQRRPPKGILKNSRSINADCMLASQPPDSPMVVYACNSPPGIRVPNSHGGEGGVVAHAQYSITSHITSPPPVTENPGGPLAAPSSPLTTWPACGRDWSLNSRHIVTVGELGGMDGLLFRESPQDGAGEPLGEEDCEGSRDQLFLL
jgi:hypothetical protein